MNQPEIADQETSSELYASRFSGGIGTFFLEIQETIVSKMISLTQQRTPSVLEVGGGHGQLLNAYQKSAAKVTIIGSDDFCKKRIQHAIDVGDVSYITAPLNQLPFPDKTFDIVVSIRLLTHAHDWQRLVKEICRVSNHSVIIDYPSRFSFNILYTLLYPLKKASEKTTRPFVVFSDSEIKNTFAAEGFIVKQRTPQFLIPMVIYRKLKSPLIASVFEKIFRTLYLTQFFGSPTLICFSRS